METREKKEKQNKENKAKASDPITGKAHRPDGDKIARSTAKGATNDQAANQGEFETESGAADNKTSTGKTGKGTSKSEQPTRQRTSKTSSGQRSGESGTPRGSFGSESWQRNRKAETLADFNYLNRQNRPGTEQSAGWRDRMQFESDQDDNVGINPHGMNTPLGMNTGRYSGYGDDRDRNTEGYGRGERTNLGYEARMQSERGRDIERDQGRGDYRNTGRYQGYGADTGSSPYRGYDRDYGSKPTDFRNRSYEQSRYDDDSSFTREESDFRTRAFGSYANKDEEERREPNYYDRHGRYAGRSNKSNYDAGDDDSYGMSRYSDAERGHNRGSYGSRHQEGSDRYFTSREPENFENRSSRYEGQGRSRESDRERYWRRERDRERSSYQGYGESRYSDRHGRDRDLERRGEDEEYRRRRGGVDTNRYNEGRASRGHRNYDDPYRQYDWGSRGGD
ncbi:Tetratricopeptide TPR_4 [Fulvivirga imtechensis AK7]|uniref:Tetratricopeptide TPR_4 n=1 Tax=Fulvivirga imtechensis AK7 TaxID=1237149 RepID=L8JJP2_9BACT|nr:hypothetical protein [Fulvivirga imtechensis]ELR69126.1 Tetratricopeptide TPR_4 [Fulvivirga imtechensis AK7]